MARRARRPEGSTMTDVEVKKAWDSVLPRKAEGDTPRDLVSPAPEALPYELVDRPEPPHVPNGWYTACSSHDLAPGERLSFIAVERELVVYRGESGRVSVLDAHCPHMGAHLGGDGQLRQREHVQPAGLRDRHHAAGDHLREQRGH